MKRTQPYLLAYAATITNSSDYKTFVIPFDGEIAYVDFACSSVGEGAPGTGQCNCTLQRNPVAGPQDIENCFITGVYSELRSDSAAGLTDNTCNMNKFSPIHFPVRKGETYTVRAQAAAGFRLVYLVMIAIVPN